MLPLALCDTGVGLLFIGLAIPLIRERIAPDPWYGYRVPRTLGDPTLWYPVNGYSGRLLRGTGIAMIIAAPIIALIPGLSMEGYVLIMSAVLVVGVLLSALLGWIHLQRLRRERS